MQSSVFFLDTETTSWATHGRVVQFAIADFSGYKKEWLIKPPTEIEIATQAVHHITPKMVENCPDFMSSEGYSELMKRLDSWEILVAHHAPFDLKILKNEGIIIRNYIDTCRVARHILNTENIRSYSLQNLRYALGLDELHTDETLTGYAHSALYDTIVLKWLYEYLYNKIKTLSADRDPLEVMKILTLEPLSRNPKIGFGKHKGKTLKEISAVDMGYIHWLYARQQEKDEFEQDRDLLISLQKIIHG